MVKINQKLFGYDDDKRLTREQAADLIGCKAGTIARHNHAGLLPYIPTRPITILAGDLKVYAKMLTSDKSKQLHRGLRIKAEDCPPYSRLDGMVSLTANSFGTTMNRVVKTTTALIVKYKGGK